MKGIAKYGVLSFLLVVSFLLLSQFGALAVPPGSEGGNWTNITVSNYPTNLSNSSDNWVTFNYTLNATDAVNNCILEIGDSENPLIYSNTTGTWSSTDVTCFFNVTNLNESVVGGFHNATLFMNRSDLSDPTSESWYWSNSIDFTVDTETPVITIIAVTRENDTSSILENFGATGVSALQDYINVTFSYFDNTSSSTDNCKIEIEWDLLENKDTTPTSFKQSYTNFTTNLISKTTVDTAETRTFESLIPASSITDGTYSGRFWVRPICTDATSHEGFGSRSWAVVNPIKKNTWTPLGVIDGTTNLKLEGWLRKNSFDGNISYAAAFPHSNASFVTNQYGQLPNENQSINTTNASALFVFSTNGWTTLRFNNTDIEAGSQVDVLYDDPSGITNGNWRSFVNLRTNTTKFIANTSSTCGSMLDWVAWFNSTDSRCLGGCWEIYNNGWNVNNETIIPFGTAVWYLTNASNVSMTQTYNINNAAQSTCLVKGIV